MPKKKTDAHTEMLITPKQLKAMGEVINNPNVPAGPWAWTDDKGEPCKSGGEAEFLVSLTKAPQRIDFDPEADEKIVLAHDFPKGRDYCAIVPGGEKPGVMQFVRESGSMMRLLYDEVCRQRMAITRMANLANGQAYKDAKAKGTLVFVWHCEVCGAIYKLVLAPGVAETSPAKRQTMAAELAAGRGWALGPFVLCQDCKRAGYTPETPSVAKGKALDKAVQEPIPPKPDAAKARPGSPKKKPAAKPKPKGTPLRNGKPSALGEAARKSIAKPKAKAKKKPAAKAKPKARAKKKPAAKAKPKGKAKVKRAR